MRGLGAVMASSRDQWGEDITSPGESEVTALSVANLVLYHLMWSCSVLTGTEVRFGTKRESFYFFSVFNLSLLSTYALLKVNEKVNKLSLAFFPQITHFQFSCVWLWDPMDCSTPGLPVYHQLLEFTQTCPLSRWHCPTISSSVIPFSCWLQFCPTSGSFQMSQFFASGAQSVGVSASTSILPMNIQD